MNAYEDFKIKSFYERKEEKVIQNLISKWVSGENDDVSIISITSHSLNNSNEIEGEGGLGKTILLYKSFIDYLAKDENAQSCSVDVSFIDCSQDGNTKLDIIEDIIHYYENISGDTQSFLETRLQISLLKEPVKNEVKKGHIKAKNVISSPDYSFIADKFKDEIAKNTTKLKPIIFFLDSYDNRYMDSEIKSWLQGIISSMINCGMKFIVAGRENLKIDKVSTKNINIEVLDKQLIGNYINEYFNPDNFQYQRINERGEIIRPALNSEEIETIKNDSIKFKDKIRDFTGGRPILVALFCDFIYAIYQNWHPNTVTPNGYQKEKGMVNLFEKLSIKGNHLSNIDNFKSYVVNNIQLTHPSSIRTENLINNMSVVRARMDNSLYVSLDWNEIKTSDIPAKHINLIKDLELRSFVKSMIIPNKNKSDEHDYRYIRLHDEYCEWMTKYYWPNEDPSNQKRNQLLVFAGKYYEEVYLTNSVNTPQWDNYLIEMFDCLFQIKGNPKLEKEVVQSFLYHYISSIDEHSSLCNRLIHKSETYFNTNTDLFSNENYFDLLEIPLRRVEYVLTIKNEKWIEEINKKILEILQNIDVINDITSIFKQDSTLDFLSFNDEKKLSKLRQYIHNYLNQNQKQILAKCLVFSGETDMWSNNIDVGLKKISLANELFYECDKVSWQIWSIHLLGFGYQRLGDFSHAKNLHIAAIQDGLREIEKILGMSRLSNRDLYRLLFIFKTISRAYSNLALNIRYSGALIESSLMYHFLIHIYILSDVKLSNEIPRAEINQLDRFVSLGYENYKIDIIKSLLTNKTKEGYLKSRYNNIRLKEFLSGLGENENSITKEFPDFLNTLTAETYNNYLNKLQNDYDEQQLKDVELRLGEIAKDIQIDNIKYTNDKIEQLYLYAKILSRMPFKQDEAKKYYNLVYEMSKITRFQYFQAEALEALFTLNYFTIQNSDKRDVEMERLKSEFENIPKIRIYSDIWVKFYNTEGDKLFEKGLLIENPDRKEDLKQAFTFYAKMISNSIKHNEHRYNISLNILCLRMERVFNDVNIKMSYWKDVLNDFKEDLNNELKMYKDTHLNSFINTLEHIFLFSQNKENYSFHENEDIYGMKIKKDITAQIGLANFSKAVYLNELLINNYKAKAIKDTNQKNVASILIPSYQNIYCFVSIQQFNKARKLLKEMENRLGKEGDAENKIKYKAWSGIVRLAKNMIYLADEKNWNKNWNPHRILLGINELHHLNVNNIDYIKQNDYESIYDILNYIKDMDESDTQKINAYLRIVCSGLIQMSIFCLIYKDDTYGDKHKNIIELIQKVMKNSDILGRGDKFNDYSYANIFIYLDIVIKISDKINDNYRKNEARHLFILSVYLTGQYDKNIQQQKTNELLLSIDTPNYRKLMPFTVAKTKMVEGSIIFSKYYSPDKEVYSFEEENKNTHIVVREFIKHFEADQIKYEYDIRKMIICYLDALDLLAMGTDYHTLEFSNMWAEIKKRILLVHDVKFIEIVENGIQSLWYRFPSLSTRKDVLADLLYTFNWHKLGIQIRVHLKKHQLTTNLTSLI